MKKETKEPIMVQIPESGQFIDIRPLVNLLDDRCSNTFETANNEIIDEIEQRIMQLNLYYVFDIEDVFEKKELIPQQLFSTLYDLRDMFKSFTFIKK